MSEHETKIESTVSYDTDAEGGPVEPAKSDEGNGNEGTGDGDGEGSGDSGDSGSSGDGE